MVEVGADRVLYSVDYLFEDMAEAAEWIFERFRAPESPFQARSSCCVCMEPFQHLHYMNLIAKGMTVPFGWRHVVRNSRS